MTKYWLCSQTVPWKTVLWSISDEFSILLSVEHHMWIFHASYSPFLCTSCYPCPLAKGGGKCGGTLGFVTEALAPAWGSCFFTFPTKPSLGFVSTAAATCSHPWPPQLSPLPQGHLACGSLCTFTEHRSCRRQQRPAAPSPAAPKIGEKSESAALQRGRGGGGLFTRGNRQVPQRQGTRMSAISSRSLQQW